ncbi:MAG: ABC transporter substrate-binding protein [Alphaproteobacteria bacterium]
MTWGDRLRLAACGTAAGVAVMALALTAPSMADAKDTVVIAIPGTPQGIDLDKNVSPQTWTMSAQVFDEGMRWKWIDYPYATGKHFDPNNVPGNAYPDFQAQNMEGALIESCDLSEDGLKAVYHIRPGVKSAVGNEFKADDVLWTVERSLATGAIHNFLWAIANMNDRSKWSKIDDHTVEITSATPMPIACKVLTNLYFPWYDSTEVKKHVADDDPWGDKWIARFGGGFGPYQVTSWEAGKRVVMEANPNYWGGVPEVKRIIYQVVPESANRIALLQQGQIDLAEGLSPDELMSLEGADKARAVATRGNQNIFMVINNAEPPFNDVRVRQALNHLLPRDEIVNSVFRGMAVPFEGVYPSSYPGHISFLGTYPFDVEKAKALLAEAGHADGFATELAFNAGDAVQENVAILLRSAFAQAGINIELKKLPVAAHADLVQSKSAKLALWVDFPIQPDPNYASTLIYESGGAINYQNYANPKTDELLLAGRTVVNMEERIAAHQEVQRVINADAPLGWIAEQFYGVGLSNAVKGYRWYTCQYYQVRDWTFE